MTTKYDPALCERLIAEAREAHAVTQREEPACGCKDRNFVEVFGAHPDADCPARIHRNAVVDAWTWKEINLSTLVAQLEAARAEIERMRAVVEAAGQMRDGHEGCVTEPPCGACFRCDFDRAVDAYRAARDGEGGK